MRNSKYRVKPLRIMYDSSCMAKSRGITLIELLIVISIIGIIAVALVFSFEGWMGTYKVEAQTKEIYTDLMNARARAMQRSRTHFVTFPTTRSYQISEDTNENGALDAGEALPNFPKTMEYVITRALTGGATRIGFSSQGRISVNGNIRMTVTDVVPDYDCISLSEFRINMGKWDAGDNNCDAR